MSRNPSRIPFLVTWGSKWSEDINTWSYGELSNGGLAHWCQLGLQNWILFHLKKECFAIWIHSEMVAMRLMSVIITGPHGTAFSSSSPSSHSPEKCFWKMSSSHCLPRKGTPVMNVLDIKSFTSKAMEKIMVCQNKTQMLFIWQCGKAQS